MGSVSRKQEKGCSSEGSSTPLKLWSSSPSTRRSDTSLPHTDRKVFTTGCMAPCAADVGRRWLSRANRKLSPRPRHVTVSPMTEKIASLGTASRRAQRRVDDGRPFVGSSSFAPEDVVKILGSERIGKVLRVVRTETGHRIDVAVDGGQVHSASAASLQRVDGDPRDPEPSGSGGTRFRTGHRTDSDVDQVPPAAHEHPVRVPSDEDAVSCLSVHPGAQDPELSDRAAT